MDTAEKDDDRTWFAQHPTRTHRTRSLHSGDSRIPRPPPGHEVLVLVRQVEPGMRLKRFFYINQQKLPVPDIEALAHALFDVVDGGNSGAPIDKDKLGMLINRYRTADQG